jgi:poly(3-hydroxybutyrate) depolymerase
LIYIPSNCQQKKPCRLHVAFHGCRQYFGVIGEVFAKDSGYNEYAESNDIIILYPQSKKSLYPYNPKGCWDYYGFGGFGSYSRTSQQIFAIQKMIKRILGE